MLPRDIRFPWPTLRNLGWRLTGQPGQRLLSLRSAILMVALSLVGALIAGFVLPDASWSLIAFTALALGASMFVLHIPLKWPFAAALLLAPFQLYFGSIQGFDPSLAFTAAFLLLVSSLRYWRAALNLVSIMYALIIFASVASLTWSPAPLLGATQILERLLFPSALAAALAVSRFHPKVPGRLLDLSLIVATIHSGLVIAFRLWPSLEQGFLTSAIAPVFIEPDSLAALFSTGRNNVLDPAKAGGLFLNANVAATFSGVVAMLAFGRSAAVSGPGSRRMLRFSGLTAWLAVIGSGSKAGLVAALVMPVLALILLLIRSFIHRRQQIRISPMLMLVVFALILLPSAIVPLGTPVEELTSDFSDRAESTLGVRATIWSAALHGFQESPFAGHGFGGWSTFFSPYALRAGLDPAFPPHNSLIYAWSQSGLPALVMVALFALVTIRRLLRGFLIWTDGHLSQHLGTLLAFVWVVYQSMGENFWIVGDVHVQPILGAAIGLSLVESRQQ